MKNKLFARSAASENSAVPVVSDGYQWVPKWAEMAAANAQLDGGVSTRTKRFHLIEPTVVKPASFFLQNVLKPTVGCVLDKVPSEEVLGFNALIRALSGGPRLSTSQARSWSIALLEGIWCEDLGLEICPLSTPTRLFRKVGTYTKVFYTRV